MRIALFGLAAALAACRSNPATKRPAADQAGLDGFWASDGYGYVFELGHDSLRVREVSAAACVLTRVMTLAGPPDLRGAVFQDHRAGQPFTIRVRGGSTPTTRRFHVDGAVSDIGAHRIAELPGSCRTPPVDTPESNFEIFWTAFAEHYPFFQLRGTDWNAVGERYRSRVTARTTPAELFGILEAMVEPLHDQHVFIAADSVLGRTWRGGRPDPTRLTSEGRERPHEIVRTRYLRGTELRLGNDRIGFGWLRDSVGYLRIDAMTGFGKTAGFAVDSLALEAALDLVFASGNGMRGLVIDIRQNGGGSDALGLAIAARLAPAPYLGYSKDARNDRKNPTRFTAVQPIMVVRSPRPGFRGPTVLLQGPHTVGAAETFALALLSLRPKVTRIGQNTQGVFSDVLVRTLPNGWRFGTPNERYLTPDGSSFEGPGLPPDIAVPVFVPADLRAGRDPALERALEALAAARNRP